MNMKLIRALGFDKEADRVEGGKCPFCGKDIDVSTEFRNASSRKEFTISGLCQSCQDTVFGVD